MCRERREGRGGDRGSSEGEGRTHVLEEQVQCFQQLLHPGDTQALSQETAGREEGGR